MRLKVVLIDWLSFYEKEFGVLDVAIKQKIIQISSATLDRLLKSIKVNYRDRGISGTKPGIILKNQIPSKNKSMGRNKTWAYGLVGKTPAIKKSGRRFKANMIVAISPQGFMNWMVFTEMCDSKKFIEFLGRMRRQINQKYFLLLTTLEFTTVKKYSDM